MDKLQKQLQIEKYKKDAEDCIKIYEKLKELNNGSVWSSQWQSLTTISGWIGERPISVGAYKPSEIGYVFLKGIKEKKEREAGVQYISVRMAIMSHLSDAQELLINLCNLEQACERGNNHVNFAKQLVLTYPDTSIEVSEEELNELWKRNIK